jgi:hypothetical protein
MSDIPQSLERTLFSLPAPPSSFKSLPTCHLTKARWFEVIVRQGQLDPQPDSYFNEKLLYFFYGGVFYRPASKTYEEHIELPIALVFDPSALSSFSRYYPFDTGGMFSGFFDKWRQKMGDFAETFKISGTDHTAPKRLVYYLFGSNEEYLRGRPSAELKNRPIPLPLLFDFLTDNLTNNNTDHRQYTIECQATEPVPLNHWLLWIGYPDYYRDVFIRLLEMLDPYVPQYYAYKASRIFNPRDIAAQLEDRARDAVIERYASLPEVPNNT